jgi:putative heme-binding domain-containing protein
VRALLLALLFGDPRAVALLTETMIDRSAPVEERRRALQALVEKRVRGLAPSLQALLADRQLRGLALKGLAAYDDPATPGVIVNQFSAFNDDERADAVRTLASRTGYALALLNAVAKGDVSKRDLDATTARQLQAFGDARVSSALEKSWGTIRPTARDKVALIAKYKEQLAPDRLKSANLAQGRRVFNRSCVACHRLFDAGGEVGPDLTGSDRANLDYILENVLDPSASVGREFRLTTIATTDGRLLSGIIREQSDKALVVQTVNERVVLPREDVEELKASDASMMPEGLFEKLAPEEVRDLIAYLGSKAQVPLPVDAAANP